MSATQRPKMLGEGLRMLVLLGGFWLLQNQILGVRYDIYGNKAGIALAENHKGTEIVQASDRVEGALKECTYEVVQARGEIEDALLRIQERKNELIDLVESRARELEGVLEERLETERDQISNTRFALEAGTAKLERIFATAKDPREMKRKMIQPTVQLKGNGTVGSGVIVYSELESKDAGAESPNYATFILTAYHVVLEVMGEKAESGIVEEIHVLPELDSGATEVLPGRLVIFDRARDVALLRLKATRRFTDVAELMTAEELSSVDVFSRAYAVGCPLGNRPLPTVGEISSKSKVVADQVFWMLSAPTFFGNSGGGVYLADSCKLIGVSSMIYTYGKTHPAVVPHMGLFVPLEAIYRWLDSEGYAFVHAREVVPRAMAWKCAFESRPTGAAHNEDSASE